MKSMWTLVSVVLFASLAFTTAEQCTAHYELHTSCNATYGTVVEKYENIASLAGCAGRCNGNTLCKSFVYRETFRTCSINSQKRIASQIGCGNDVTYAEAHGKTCGSGSELPEPPLPPSAPPPPPLPPSAPTPPMPTSAPPPATTSDGMTD